jgi:hypothetical protein
VEQWLKEQSNIAVLYVHYSDILAKPEEESRKINAFMGGQLDIERMATVIDPDLYRNRQEQLSSG